MSEVTALTCKQIHIFNLTLKTEGAWIRNGPSSLYETPLL